jgi:hypothetical protein
VTSRSAVGSRVRIPRGAKDFAFYRTFRPVLGSGHPPIQWYLGSYPGGGKSNGTWVRSLTSISGEGTNKWSHVSSSPVCLYVVDSDRFYKTDLTKLLDLRHSRRLATVFFTNSFTFAILGSKSISLIPFLFSPMFWTSKYLVTCTFLYRLSLPAKETNTCFVSAIRSCSLYITESIKIKTFATTFLLT